MDYSLNEKQKQDPLYRQIIEQSEEVIYPKEHFDNPNQFYRYKNCLLQDQVLHVYSEYENQWQAKHNDVYVTTFPKTGTTWLQETVYTVCEGIEKAQTIDLEDRFPYMERCWYYNDLSDPSKFPTPRFIKSHLPYHMLPESIKNEKCKILCVVRNPKDTVVSYFHFQQMVMVYNYVGDFETFVNYFLDDKVEYCPLADHYLSYWARRHDDNVLFLKYEDMHKDYIGQLQKIAKFLNRTLEDEQAHRIARHCSFQSMADNPKVNFEVEVVGGIFNKEKGHFYRKGKVGDWKNYFTPKLNAKMDAWIDEKFKGSGLEFDYEIE